MMNTKEKIIVFFKKKLFENYLKNKEMWNYLIFLCMGLGASFIGGYLNNRYKLEETIYYLINLTILFIVFLFLVIYFIKEKFNPGEEFENKCKKFGCEFLIFYSKEKNFKYKYDKLLPILENWKLGYYAILLPVYLGLVSLIILNKEFKNELKVEDYYYIIYILVVLAWLLGKVFIHKILLMEKILKYKSKFSDELIPSLTEIIFALLITFLGMLNMFKVGEALQLI